MCTKICRQDYDLEPITIHGVEEFNLQLLKEHNNKFQLYFWIGYLMYKKSKNYPLALQYLEEFNKHSNQSTASLKQKSDAYLIDIKNLMTIKR